MADEWKNWALLFSVICLHDLLPAADLDCWYIFVATSKIYSSSLITVNETNAAHTLMRRFFITSELLYGPKFLKLNAH